VCQEIGRLGISPIASRAWAARSASTPTPSARPFVVETVELAEGDKVFVTLEDRGERPHCRADVGIRVDEIKDPADGNSLDSRNGGGLFDPGPVHGIGEQLIQSPRVLTVVAGQLVDGVSRRTSISISP
jgi:hypothetical protein